MIMIMIMIKSTARVGDGALELLLMTVEDQLFPKVSAIHFQQGPFSNEKCGESSPL
jgi:hypothetical protein